MAKVTKSENQFGNNIAVIVFIVAVIVIVGSGLAFYFEQAKVGSEIKKEDTQNIGFEPKTSAPIQKTLSLVNIRQDEILGSILVATNGMTLYTYKADIDGVSMCLNDCAVNWPPLLIQGELVGDGTVTGTLAIVERTDGQKQITYNGAPLYFYKNDKVPGDATGNGLNDNWSVVTP